MGRRRRNSFDECNSRWVHVVRILVVLLLVFPGVPSADAYRVGDAVDTILQTPSDTSDMRQQMPRFGVFSVAAFSGLSAPRFSLAFEEGFRQLPWVDAVNSHGRTLERLIVTFIYSKSGGGAIHSLSSQTIYSESGQNPGNFRAEYVWIEEEAVDIHAGASVMFLATLGAAVLLLLHTCGIIGDTSHDDYSDSHPAGQGSSMVDDGSYTGYTDHASVVSSASEPKWE